MNLFRQLLTILLIPVYLVVGAFTIEWVSRIFGVWQMYTGAIVLPTIGLLATYFIAPYYKTYNVTFIYIVGITLAYILGYPAQYPEGSEHPYQWTYKPFALTLIWSTVLLAGLLFKIKRESAITRRYKFK